MFIVCIIISAQSVAFISCNQIIVSCLLSSLARETRDWEQKIQHLLCGCTYTPTIQNRLQKKSLMFSGVSMQEFSTQKMKVWSDLVGFVCHDTCSHTHTSVHCCYTVLWFYKTKLQPGFLFRHCGAITQRCERARKGLCVCVCVWLSSLGPQLMKYWWQQKKNGFHGSREIWGKQRNDQAGLLIDATDTASMLSDSITRGQSFIISLSLFSIFINLLYPPLFLSNLSHMYLVGWNSFYFGIMLRFSFIG